MFHLKEGDPAPQWEAEDQHGNTVRLSDYKGSTLILYFYPKDDTPGCTAEACNFRDHYSGLKEKGFEVVGVSPDPVSKHLKFAGKYEPPFTLLADTDTSILNAYGVWGRKKFMGREYDGVHRTTFIINGDGVIERIINKVNTKNSAAQVLEVMGLN